MAQTAEIVARNVATAVNHLTGGDCAHHPRVDFDMLTWQIVWHYKCPCGEISGYAMLVHAGTNEAKAVELTLEAMRRHVRSEGNEPNF